MMFKIIKTGALIVSIIIVVTVLVVFDNKPKSTRTTPNPTIFVTGLEHWEVGDKLYKIEQTEIILFANNEGLLSINVIVDTITDDGRGIAKSIANYARRKSYINKATEILSSKLPNYQLSDYIGVAMIVKNQSIGINVNKGERFLITPNELLQN